MRRGLAAFTLAAMVSLSCLTTPAAAGPLEDAASFFDGVGESIANFFGIAPQDAGDISADIVDADTGNAYKDSLGDDLNTAANGRVWTDKSVYTDDVTYSGDIDNGNNQGGSNSEKITADKNKGEEFLVSYSALATSQQITGKADVPVDVVFVIDNSNSMDEGVGGGSRQSRLEATVDAVNASIKTLMDSNPDSRVGVVLFGNGSDTLMPLAHYDQTLSGDSTYITCSSYSSWLEQGNTFTAVTSNGSSRRVRTSSSNRGTNTNIGVYAGMNMLATVSSTTTTVAGKEIPHAPAMVLLSDGQATYFSQNEQWGSWANWWTPTGCIGSGGAGSDLSAMKTMMNAAYMKQQEDKHYGLTENSSYRAKVYTIGMGIGQLEGAQNINWATTMLDPTNHLDDNNAQARSLKSAWETYASGGTPTVVGTEKNGQPGNNYTFRHPSTDDINSTKYNDGYYPAENAEEVSKASRTSRAPSRRPRLRSQRISIRATTRRTTATSPTPIPSASTWRSRTSRRSSTRARCSSRRARNTAVPVSTPSRARSTAPCTARRAWPTSRSR